jgi:23S rRNA (cytidine1920-2'-O)/16S rRNA (cytidine1409-2'-O)-methyltransferase
LTGQGWSVIGVVESPITGPEGNVEFLIAALHGEDSTVEESDVEVPASTQSSPSS